MRACATLRRTRQPPEKARTGRCSSALVKPRPCSSCAPRARASSPPIAPQRPCSSPRRRPSSACSASRNCRSIARSSASPSSTNSSAARSLAASSCDTCASCNCDGMSKLPDSGWISPRTSDSRLDLPLPFSPVMPIFSPRNRLKVAPLNSTRLPRRMLRSLKLSISRAHQCTWCKKNPAPTNIAVRATPGISSLQCRQALARCALLLADRGVFHLPDRTADIHEAASSGVVQLAPAVRMGRKARARRNQPTDDDVLLQAAQIVLESAHRRFGQHAGGLLERGRRDERFGGQRRLGDTEQHRLQTRRLLAVGLDLVVDVERPRAVDLLTAQQRGLADRHHLGLAQHLPDDDLDVLVVDLHALQTVDVLDLAHPDIRAGLEALQTQNVVRIRLAIGDHLTTLDRLALEHVQLTRLRNQLLVLL